MKKRILLLLLTGILSAPVYSQVPQKDSLALVDIYNNMGGPSWTDKTNWLSGNVGTWFGVTVSGGRVRELHFYNNNLQGPIPVSIGALDSLTWIDMNENGLSGQIPDSLFHLTQLTQIGFYGGKYHGIGMSGPLSSRIGQLTKLNAIQIAGNLFSGSIPTEIGNLSQLQYLWLGQNEFTGAIPASIWNLTSLLYLDLSDNQFTVSTIPSQVGNLVNLFDLTM